MVGISSDGLASGLNTTEIIDSIMAVERRPVDILESRKEREELKLEAIQTFNTRLLTASLDLSNVRRGSTYGGRTASSSSSSVLSANASSSAIPGSYDLNIVRKASSHQLATSADAGLGGQSSPTTGLGAGTFDLQVGNGSIASITIEDGASSLADVAAAITDSGLGVTASVVQDGTTGLYRMIMQASETGRGNDITLSNITGAGMTTLFGNTTTLTAAADAEVQLGTTNPISVTASGNEITDLIPGVTLNLTETGNTTVTVSADNEPVVEAISSFVESFNSALEYLNDNTAFDPVNNEGGILISESDLRRGMNDLIASLSQTVDTGSNVQTIFQAGLSFDRESNLLTFDESELRGLLSTEPDTVRKLFVNTGTSSSVGVSFVGFSNDTNVSSPFAVDITTAAKRAQAVGTSALGASTVITGANNGVNFKINETVVNLTLSDGTYTRDQIVSLLQDGIDDVLGTDRVTVGRDGSDQLTFTSVAYGALQEISIDGGTGLGDLGLSTGAVSGVDVAGTINGVAATGTGQNLRSTDGLNLQVTSTAPVSGVTVTATRGIGSIVKDSFDDLTDVGTGLIPNKEDGLTAIITDITGRIEEGEERLDAKRVRLQQEFVQLEVLLAQFQSQETFLAGQIEGFQATSSANARRGT